MRILKILALLLTIPLLLIATVLAKSHWEIRQIGPALPTLETLQATLNSAEGPIRIGYILNASQPSREGQAASYPAFVLQWRDGRRFLVDAGMDAQGAREFGELAETLFGAGPIQFEATVADQLGNGLADLQAIAFTHLHNDHTGGSQAICEAATGSITLFQTPWQAGHSNYTTQPGVEDLARASCLNRQLLGDPQLNSIPGFPGLIAISAGGHTPGSTIYAAQVNGTTWLLAGDISNEKAALLTNRPKPFWYRWFITPEAGDRQEELRLWLAELDAQADFQVVLSHDLGALQASEMERIEVQDAAIPHSGE